MKFELDITQRSQLSRGGKFVTGGILLFICVAALFTEMEPTWMKWALGFISLGGIICLVLWRAEVDEKSEEEDFFEMARDSIRSESERLDKKRGDLERVLMAYGEWMEFPDFEQLQNFQWEEELFEGDERISEMIEQQADKLLTSFSDGELWVDGKFQTRDLMLDLFSFIEEIARIYNPDAERPILETNLESLLKAINRASLQIILLVEEIPILDVKDMNIRKATDSIRKASKAYRTYEDLKPILEPMRYLWQGSKFIFSSNPVVAAGWIAGSELVLKEGKKIGKKALDTYLLSMVRQSLGIIAWETAGIYDKTYRYRNPDWIYGLELAHFASKFEPTTEFLRAVFKELGSLPLRSSYDRLFLYRCLANHVSPKPASFSTNEWLSTDLANEIEEKLVDFTGLVLGEDDMGSKNYDKWRKDMQARIGAQMDVELVAE